MTTTDTIRLASEALAELDQIRASQPEIVNLTAGPRLILSRALEIAARQPPATAAASVRGSAGLAGTVIAGALARRVDLRNVADGRLRDVASALVSISMVQP